MKKRPFTLLFFTLILATFNACLGLQKYKAPGGNEPRAFVKLQYATLNYLPGTDLYVQMTIQEENGKKLLAYEKSYGTLSKNLPTPKLETVSIPIHIDKPATFRMKLYFHWIIIQQYMETVYVNNSTRTRWKTRPIHHTRGCEAAVRLLPKKNQLYLLDYSNQDIDKHCTIKAYRQSFSGKGKFKLLTTGEKTKD